MTTRTPKSYRQAIAELDTLLQELDSDDLDIDTLTEKVGRSAELLEFCRKRLGETELAVRKIVARLSEEPTAGPGPEADPEN